VAKDRPELASLLIPQQLIKGANSVVRNSQTRFVYINKTKGTEVQYQEISILNEKGLNHAQLWIYGDKYRKLKEFTATIYDASGKEIKQYKKSDLGSTQWSGNLSSDDLIYYWECTPRSYPFTLVYQYENEWKNGIFFFPEFAPQGFPDQAIQVASYTLQTQPGVEIITEKNKFIPEPTKSDEQNIKKYTWLIKDIPCTEEENFAPLANELHPLLYAAPSQFYYDGFEGNYSSIKEIGDFQNKLNENRNTLTDATKAKIIEMTKNASTDREKVKILYDYLGQTTRYESIQLGIGGWQPIASGDVCKNGFGDCKGLSFYLKSMLETIGIPSNYTVIGLDKEHKSLKNNFSAFLTSNHVILQVPLPQDTLWLECTNTRVPFGFVHNRIAGHNAVVVTPSGGVMKQLIDYPDSSNISRNRVKITFKLSEPSEITVENSNHLKQYDELAPLTYLKPMEQVDFVRKNIRIPNAIVSQLVLNEDKSARPTLTLNYRIVASPYGTATGNRYFLPLNTFRTDNFKLKKARRLNDIVISSGWRNIDKIEIQLPENADVEYLPAPIVLQSPFGEFRSAVSQEGKTIRVEQELLVSNGRWAAERYKEFQEFVTKTMATYGESIVVKAK
jgi:hypothetical protein